MPWWLEFLSGGDGIPVELFQILKDDAVKVLHSICQQIWKTRQWPPDWKSQFSFQSQRKAMPKNAQTTAQSHFISHASKVMLKILQVRLQLYMNRELPDIQAGFRKRQRNQRSNCQHPLDYQNSRRVPEKLLFLLYWLCQSLWLSGSQQTVENSEKDGNTRPPDLPLEKSVYRSGSNS